MSDDARRDPVAKVRVHAAAGESVRVYAGGVAWTVDGRTRFGAGEGGPSALDALLGALGADLALAFTRAARHAGVAVRALEITLEARVENALVVLDVIGESGSPALTEITGAAFASADVDPALAARLWADAIARSTIHATLARATRLAIALRLVP